MSDAAETIAQLRAQRAAGRPTLPCSSCSGAVDPLRAARVAIFGERFHYFCSVECRERFAPGSALAPPPTPLPAAPDDLVPVSELERRGVRIASPTPPPTESEHPAGAAVARAPSAAELPPALAAAPAAPLEHHPELLAAAALGAAALVCDLLAPTATPAGLAPGLAVAAYTALCWGTWRRGDLVWRGPALLGLLPPLVATLAALGSLLLEGRSSQNSASVAGAICFAAATSLALVSRRRQALAPLQQRLEQALLGNTRRPGAAGKGKAAELRPGEEFLLEPGDCVPADGVVLAGRARVEPWFESRLRVPRQEGDTLLAGARVLDGELRAVVRWAGVDRAWARLTLDPARRADRHAGPARLAERLCTSGALALGALGALLAFSTQPEAVLALSAAAALAATLANIALPELVALQLSSGLHELLARGISFRGPAALDRAAQTSAVVFCAEGTLFSDEPSVASIEPTPNLSSQELLASIAGAYAGVAAPLAAALQRCAQAYQVRPDATRSPHHHPGLGVTAVASSGQPVVVGTRALLLERRISVASAETRIAELEALGRGVLLAALDGRYVGLLALQDNAAAGARSAVQTLLEVDVEPILLSGGARDTCRALGQQLGIEHVRPEVLPEARTAELRRLADTTPSLAVVGRSSKDDATLGAAPLSINIDEAGGPLERWDVDIASGDVCDAASAVALARRLYAATTRSILIASAPVLVALLLLLLALPIWFAPLAGLLGSALALHRAQGNGRPLRPSRVSAEDSG